MERGSVCVAAFQRTFWWGLREDQPAPGWGRGQGLAPAGPLRDFSGREPAGCWGPVGPRRQRWHWVLMPIHPLGEASASQTPPPHLSPSPSGVAACHLLS